MKRWVVMLFILVAPILSAQDWAPIPSEVWTYKEDVKAGVQGAIVLDEEVRYGVKDSEYRYRILILSEAGKAAAQLDPFPASLYKLEGRTVYPDGRVIEFSKVKDFSEMTLGIGSFESKHKVVIPPGLTAHCIVDLHWITTRGQLGNNFVKYIQNTYQIRRLVIKATKLLPLNSQIRVPDSMEPKITYESGYRVFTFLNLPAFIPAPYSRAAFRSAPYLLWYFQHPDLFKYQNKSPEIYWEQAVKLNLKSPYTHLSKGWKFNPFAEEILKDLPVDPIQKVSAIINRLNTKILNINWATASEMARRTKSDDEEYTNPTELSEAVKRGWTTNTGMFFLAYQLMNDAGLHPQILLIADRDAQPFQYSIPDYYQFSYVLLGINSADGKAIAWVDPSNRFLPLGIIYPNVQGMGGLLVDSQDWTSHYYSMPSQPFSSNHFTYSYNLKVDEDRESFKVDTTLKGYPEYFVRYEYYATNSEDGGKKLKETFESALPSFSIERAVVDNAADRTQPVSLHVEGSKTNDGGRRMQFDPFPGMDRPLGIPNSWPDQRNGALIVMPYCFVWTAISHIHIPDGWKVSQTSPITFSNDLGSVSWALQQIDSKEGPELELSYEVTVKKLFQGSGQTDNLKSFLDAVQEGWDRKISIEHSR